MNHIIKKSSKGFTIIEALVTIVVGGIFVISFAMLYTSITQSFAQTRNRAVANDLAYSYLRKYAGAGATPTWFTTCDSSTDVTQNSNATGQTLTSGTLTSEASGLPSPATYSVKALAIFGCSGVNHDKPVRVEATITYGPSNTIIKHATIVAY